MYNRRKKPMLTKPYKTIDNIKIYGNNQYRYTYYLFELSEKWQKIAKEEFDWIDSSDTVTWDEEKFFIYKNQLYCLSDFMNVHNTIYNPNPPNWLKEFDGYNNDSFFSGILIKFDNEDNDYIKVYTFIS